MAGVNSHFASVSELIFNGFLLKMLLRSRSVYILKQLFFSISVNSGRIFTSPLRRVLMAGGLAKLVIFVQFYSTVVSYGLYEPYLLLTNSSFILIFVRGAQGMFIIWVKFVELPKQIFGSQLNAINPLPNL